MGTRPPRQRHTLRPSPPWLTQDPEIKQQAEGLCPRSPRGSPALAGVVSFGVGGIKPFKPPFDASLMELNLFFVFLGINLQFSASSSLPFSPRKGRRKNEGKGLHCHRDWHECE